MRSLFWDGVGVACLRRMRNEDMAETLATLSPSFKKPVSTCGSIATPFPSTWSIAGDDHKRIKRSRVETSASVNIMSLKRERRFW